MLKTYQRHLVPNVFPVAPDLQGSTPGNELNVSRDNQDICFYSRHLGFNRLDLSKLDQVGLKFIKTNNKNRNGVKMLKVARRKVKKSKFVNVMSLGQSITLSIANF